MTARFSVCVLLYGEHPELARRCLGSLAKDPGYREHVKEFRIGLNHVSRETYDYAIEWGRSPALAGSRVIYYLPEGNLPLKYPLMRVMLHDRLATLARSVMWFDDDSYLAGDAGWWNNVSELAANHPAIGQIWYMPLTGGQRAFFRSQPWYDGSLRELPRMRFLQGAWWVIEAAVLLKYNWPIPELRHNGGDSMFGELCRHRNIPLLHYDAGVLINADEFGRHSKSARRGLSERNIGYDYGGLPLPTEHHDFLVRRWVQPCE